MTSQKSELNRRADAMARRCLKEAVGEPGYAVLLIFDYIDDDHERRRTINALWNIMERTSR